MRRRGVFDYILLETSGLADPGRLAGLFWVDEGLGSAIYLDGIVALVDAGNVLRSLDECGGEKGAEAEAEKGGGETGHQGMHMTTAHLQISHADVVIVNKYDSVTPEQLVAVEERIRAINGLAKVQRTRYSRVPRLEGVLLDLHAYDGVESLDTAAKGHSHLDPVGLLCFDTVAGFERPFTDLSVDHIDHHASPPRPLAYATR